jgi:hypothetical protein
MFRITNLTEFQNRAGRAVDEAMLLYVNALSTATQQTFTFIVAGSPVLTGRYRASHRVSVGTPNRNTARERLSADEFARLVASPLPPPEAHGADVGRLTRVGQTVWFNNSISYASDVEQRYRTYELGRQACEQFLLAEARKIARTRIN